MKAAEGQMMEQNESMTLPKKLSAGVDPVGIPVN